MEDKRWDSRYCDTVVCVDECADGAWRGRLMNPGLEEPVAFRGVMHFLLEMERLLDDTKFPEPFARTRTFASVEPPLAGTASGPEQGRAATFSLRILFRQNASWQGSVRWLEGRREESFRSVLELLLMMNSALSQERAGGGE
ncbi:hypothetical protein [Oscillibacter sp.]|uniref:hypothetical protein n=1 Tax=Oscillibacter sp. TaxID=1945593 RepID=UPI00289E9A20|nr:hypothetical protein [Oscillibacter sp.]